MRNKVPKPKTNHPAGEKLYTLTKLVVRQKEEITKLRREIAGLKDKVDELQTLVNEYQWVLGIGEESD